jgi:hypothetical protein
LHYIFIFSRKRTKRTWRSGFWNGHLSHWWIFFKQSIMQHSITVMEHMFLLFSKWFETLSNIKEGVMRCFPLIHLNILIVDPFLTVPVICSRFSVQFIIYIQFVIQNINKIKKVKWGN